MELGSLIIAVFTLVVAIISAFIAYRSLKLMGKIDETTSKFAKKRAAVEDKFYEAMIKSLEGTSLSDIKNDSKINNTENKETNILDKEIDNEATKISLIQGGN